MIWIPYVLLTNIDLATTTPYIDYQSSGQRAGTITMTVNGNDFYEASPETPVFLRFRLDKGTQLAETLVDLETALRRSQPVYLAMSLLANDDSVLKAPSHTVSIVRWKQGESDFWLRIQTTSNLWVESPEGSLVPADIFHRVQWTIGQSVQSDRAHNEPLYALGKANLQANMRSQQAVPTFIILNTANSILNPLPYLNAEQNFDSIAFSYQTMGVRTEAHSYSIILGDNTPANFSGDDTIGIGVAGTDRLFLWPDLTLQPVLKVLNPTDEQQVAVVRGDRFATSVYIAEPGLNLFSLNDSGLQGRWLSMEEEDAVIAQFAYQNVSGHQFTIQESHFSAQLSFLLKGLEHGSTTLRLANAHSVTVNVVFETVDQNGNAQSTLGLSLVAGKFMTVPINAYLTDEPVLARLKCTRPIYADISQQFNGENGVGWVKSVPPLLAPEEGVTF